MKAGKLNKRVNIQSVTETRDDSGGVVETWTTEITVWVSIESMTGKELFAAQELQSEITHKINMRYLTGMTTKKRILYGSRIFNILSVDMDTKQGKELVIMAKEKV